MTYTYHQSLVFGEGSKVRARARVSSREAILSRTRVFPFFARALLPLRTIRDNVLSRNDSPWIKVHLLKLLQECFLACRSVMLETSSSLAGI